MHSSSPPSSITNAPSTNNQIEDIDNLCMSIEHTSVGGHFPNRFQPFSLSLKVYYFCSNISEQNAMLNILDVKWILAM